MVQYSREQGAMLNACSFKKGWLFFEKAGKCRYFRPQKKFCCTYVVQVACMLWPVVRVAGSVLFGLSRVGSEAI